MYKIKIIFFALLLLSAGNDQLFSIQTDKDTELFIIGTVHESTEAFNSDTLLNIFNKIKPDVILVECDTSYMTPEFKLKEDIEYMFPETIAITEYSKNNPVKLRPYDINGRDVFLDDPERQSYQYNFFNEIYTLNENKEFEPDAQTLYDKIQSMTVLAGEMSNARASYINSAEGSSGIDTINYYTYDGMKKLIEQTPVLSKYESYWKDEYEFTNKRNETMLKNILRFKEKFTGKRIIVLCGFAHKNYLKRNLNDVAAKEELLVKEYYEY
ncbi:MAG: hypothetical protein IPL53_09280 [Ignavibacteria bacterium]|nr:hypothetical protein [Ignavibacteria bacterium]